MSKQVKRNFIKKNILLQKNLEIFLLSSQLKIDKSLKSNLNLSQEFNRNGQKKSFFVSASKLKLKKQSLGGISFSDKFYKPIQSKGFLTKFQNQFEKTTFFPSKKPFMQFWIFPLFGACYLSFFTFNKDILLKDNVRKFFPDIKSEISSSTARNNGKDFQTKNVLAELLQPDSFSQVSKVLPNSDLVFFATYPNNHLNTVQKNQMDQNVELLELERLWTLYLNLTTKLGKVESTSSPHFLLENHLLQSLYLKKSMFNWIWHPLSMNLKTSPDKLTKKLNLTNFKKSPELYFLNLSSQEQKNAFNNPVAQYYQASSTLDKIFKDTLVRTSSVQDIFLPKNLKNLSNLENVTFSHLKKDNLIFYFSLLLNELDKSKEEITKKYNQILLDQTPFKRSAANRSLNSEQHLPKFQKNLKGYYKVHFLKIFLNNYVKKLSVRSLDSETSFNKHLSSNLFPTHFSTTTLNEKNLTKRLKDLLLYQTKQQNFLTNNEKQVFLNKLKFLMEVKSKSITTDMNKRIYSSNSLDSLMLKDLFYNVVMLQKWNQLFQMKNLHFVNLYSTQNPSQLKTSSILNFQKINHNPSFSNLRKSRTNLDKQKNFDLVFFKQLYLYNKLMNLSQSLETFSLDGFDLGSKQVKNEILSLQNPLLLSNLHFNKFENKDRSGKFSFKSTSLEAKTSSLGSNSFKNLDILSSQSRQQSSFENVKSFISKSTESIVELENQKHQIKNVEKTLEFIKQFFTTYSTNFKGFATIQKKFPVYPDSQTFSDFKKFDLLLKSSEKTLESPLLLLNSGLLKLPNTVLLKKTTKLKLKTSASSFDKRKAEKIFRLYSSVKSPQNSNQSLFKSALFSISKQLKPNEQNFQNIYPILRHLKQTVKKERLLKEYCKSSFAFNSSSLKLVKSYKKNYSFLNQNTAVIKKSPSQKMFIKQLRLVHFFKKSNLEFLNSTEKTYVEKTQLTQKKRRLKKLKLENRRRKKRKRFYPRPFSLRLSLYFSFLEKRHSFDFGEKLPRLSGSTSHFKKNNLNSLSLQLENLKTKIYRQNRQNWGMLGNNLTFVEKSTLRNFFTFLLKPDYHQQELYKISNKTLTEFEKLCWKSYWLKSNLTPYVSKIQKTLQRMKEIETIKSSKNLMSTFLPYKFSFNQFETLKSKGQSKTIVPLYLNINYLLQNPILTTETLTNFKQLSHKMEYDSFLYDRITDEIKNVKSQLNIDGNSQARSYKSGRQKIEKNNETTLLNFIKPFEFNSFETQIHDRSQKPFSSKLLDHLPTLRVLWAFHKTNLFQIKENNFSRQLWEGYKNREKTKSNKTRKFISRLLPMNWGLNSQKNFQTVSRRKTELIEKKLQLFGQSAYKKNYQQYLRSLKYQLGNHLSSAALIKENIENTSNQLNKVVLNQYFQKDILNQKEDSFSKKMWFNSLLTNKLQKPIVNFWWSTTQTNPLDVIFPNLFLDPSVSFPTLNSYIGQSQNSLNVSLETSKFDLNNTVNKPILLTTFWVSCFLFHIAILFTVIRIPEVRSLLKFQFLVFLKLTNIYLIGLSSLHDLFSNYKNKVSFLLIKLKKFSFSKSPETPQIEFLSNLPENPFGNIKRQISSEKKINSIYFFQHNLSFKDSSLKPEFKFNSITFYQSQRNLKNFTNFAFQSTLRSDFLLRDFIKHTTRKSDLKKVFFNHLKSQSLYSVSKQTENLNKMRQVSVTNVYSSFTQILWYNISNSLFSQKNLLIEKKRNYFAQLPKTQGSTNINSAVQVSFKASSLKRSMYKAQFFFSLSSLYLMKSALSIFYLSFDLFYKILFKIIDGFEAILFVFYKFLEKPAEVMVNWIAEFFLIEWSSNLVTYIPEIFDQQVWNSFSKFSRSIRVFSPLLSSFVIQRFFLNTFQTFYFWLYKQDMDLLIRQKKGIIFWDIWAEILIQAAEKYKMNLSSLNTIKEEQELLIENLVKETSPVSNSKTRSTVLSDLNINFSSFSRFLNNYPSLLISNTNRRLNSAFNENSSNMKRSAPKFQKLLFKSEQVSTLTLFENQSFMNLQKRWSVNQYLITQGRDTDLFMDIHPPKSFSQLNFLKNYVFSHELLASLSCEIYSGLFLQKISKNLLIIGPSGGSKTVFIQALAGETELKIVTDNARRYSLVQGGVPIGMKLLRDVFDSIVLHSPCLFLLEDIHIIGERRPNLMSDEEILKSKDLTFGAEQDEVHEKNRMIYQVSRHSISHYKRPYKGDFSFAIPTNHFCYDLFLGIQPPRKRRSDLTVKSPLPLAQIQKNLEDLDTSKIQSKNHGQPTLISLLQTSLEQFFAPPSTSPFNILLLKEQKKLKPYKIVHQMPWSGLSYDQFILISKTSYSIRTKVALLAEIAMNSLNVKLDMITDLLVIVDSVRSNHGFVVFATTHLPALLDPALRRPGRFDETLHLPNFPSLLSRFEIFKVNLLSYSDTTDFLDYSFANLESYKTNSEIEYSISKTLSLLFNTKQNKSLLSFKSGNSVCPNSFNDYQIFSLPQAFYTSLKLPLFNIATNKYKKVSVNKILTNQNFNKTQTLSEFLNENQFYSVFNSTNLANYLSLNYGQAGQFLIQALVLQDQPTFLLNSSNVEFTKFDETNDQLNFTSFYYSNFQSKNYLLKLFSAKFSEFFALTSCSQNHNSFVLVNQKHKNLNSNSSLSSEFIRNNVTKLTVKTSSQTLNNRQSWVTNSLSMQKNVISNTNFQNVDNFQSYWQSALIFLDSFFQKRYLYNKNSVVSKMLFFENFVQLRQPPSPPNSSILKPARQFENYKRTLKEFTEKPLSTINEKIKAHQNQRFLKVLYNVNIQKSFKNLSSSKQPNNDNNLENLQNVDFSNSFKELSYLDFLTLKPSSSYNVYKTNILTRQRFQFLNQWWNGQLPEHTVESTYLSHIDWRSMFIESLGDFVIDFPDAEQYYNPKNRRWFLNSKSWAYWLDFEQTYKSDISNYLILESLITTYNILNSNRELFDSLTFSFLRNSKMKEIDFINLLIRFYKTSDF